MNQYITYFAHTTYTPPNYHRRYDLDIPQKERPETLFDQTKRVALLVVPFFSLYRPFFKVFSVSMNSCRLVFLLSSVCKEGYNKNLQKCIFSLLQTALVMIALVGTFFHFTLGLSILTFVDLLRSSANCLQALWKKDWDNALKELLYLFLSAIYLCIIFTGSQEIILASIILQAILCFYVARKEIVDGKYPEAVAKIAMGMIRIYQAKNQLALIQRKNFLSSLKKFQELKRRIEKGKKVRHLIHSELNDTDQKINKQRVILEDAEGNQYDFGYHTHGYGKGLVKGANLAMKIKIIDGKEKICLEFKVNHVFKNRLQLLVQETKQLQKEKDLQDVFSFNHSSSKDITIKTVPFDCTKGQFIGTAEKITFEGVGSILIGSSSDFPNTYDKVIVQVDKDKNIYHLHELLSFLDLEDAICVSSPNDIERLKIGHLFRNFFPRKATFFERKEKFFHLSIEDLKKEIIKEEPQMQKVFQEHLPVMGTTEILKGRVRYTIPTLVEQASKNGIQGLTASITGTNSKQEMFDRVVSIIKMGMLSSEMRYTNNMKAHGLSPSYDFYTGGADSVYTQVITKNQCEKEIPLRNALNYYNQVQLVFSKELLKMGSYQYPYDAFGDRRVESFDPYALEYQKYINRPSLVEFAKIVSKGNFSGNELMFKERISPDFFQKIIVPNVKMKQEMISHFKMRDIVEMNQNGVETVLGIPIEEFIAVGENASNSLFS